MREQGDLGEKSGLDWKAHEWSSRMNIHQCSSSSAVHNTQAGFSRWALWEKHDKSVGRGVDGSCACFAELCAYFWLLIRNSCRSPRRRDLKGKGWQQEGGEHVRMSFSCSFEPTWTNPKGSGSNTEWLTPMLPKCTLLCKLSTASWLF